MYYHGFILLLGIFGKNHIVEWKDLFENYSVIFIEIVVQETKLQYGQT